MNAPRPSRLPPAARSATLALVVAVVLTFASAGAAGLAAQAGAARTLTVFAAASLTEAFTLIGKVLEQRNPGLRVILNFAGSQTLAAQIEQGTRADVFASADHRWMEHVRARGLLAAAPVDFVRNRLVVIVPRANPARIARLQGLARPGLKVVLAAEAVPVGQYSRKALENLNRAPGFERDFAARVLRNVVSQEDNVRGVVSKVALGEADAGIVYRSDVTPATAGRVTVIDIPDPYNVIASYPIAVLKAAPNLVAAREFVALVLSPLGQRVLRDHNFVTVPPP